MYLTIQSTRPVPTDRYSHFCTIFVGDTRRCGYIEIIPITINRNYATILSWMLWIAISLQVDAARHQPFLNRQEKVTKYWKFRCPKKDPQRRSFRLWGSYIRVLGDAISVYHRRVIQPFKQNLEWSIFLYEMDTNKICLTCSGQCSQKECCFLTFQHVSSGEERRAHNPEVPGSKPGHAMSIFFLLFLYLPSSCHTQSFVTTHFFPYTVRNRPDSIVFIFGIQQPRGCFPKDPNMRSTVHQLFEVSLLVSFSVYSVVCLLVRQSDSFLWGIWAVCRGNSAIVGRVD